MPRPFATINPDPEDDSRPEWSLIAALLRQAVADAASSDPTRQEDIRRFLSQDGPHYWGELLGLADGFVEAFAQALEHHLQPAPRARP
jgi:hypothetical protein